MFKLFFLIFFYVGYSYAQVENIASNVIHEDTIICDVWYGSKMESIITNQYEDGDNKIIDIAGTYWNLNNADKYNCYFGFKNISKSKIETDINLDFYDNPENSPSIPSCYGNKFCDAFYQLSQQWELLPDNFQLEGLNIKKYAEYGDAYTLWKTFPIKNNLVSAGLDFFYNPDEVDNEQNRIFSRGLAVILFIKYKLKF